jgi:hypothetical protein
VVTAELPRILNDIIGTVFDSAGDIQVVGRATRYSDLVELTHELHPDVVIMGMDDLGPAVIGWDLFAGDPLLRVLGVVGEGRQTFGFELRPQRAALGELSPNDLVAAVRRMAEGRLAARAAGGGTTA